MSVLQLAALHVTAGGHPVCENLDLHLEPGQSLGILGRNGAGKTTLLHTIMGLLPPDAGRIKLHGIDSTSMPRRRLAREVGLLFQESAEGLPATVMETALLGRHPHADNLFWDSTGDVALTQQALSLVGLAEFSSRQVSSLSGGEKQRLAVATLITQDPGLLLLDEPSNHLDIDHQLKILELLTSRTRVRQRGLIMASHDINLVARFCDRALLLLGDGRFIEGPTRQLLDSELLEQTFGVRMHSIESAHKRYFLPV